MGRTLPFDCPGCGKVLDWGDFGPSGNDPDQAKLDKPQCTCHGWEWDGDHWAMLADTPDPTAETLPNPQACYALCACVKCSTDGAEPNPFTCTVDIRHVGKYHEVWLTLANDDMWWALEEFLLGLPTKEEADTHAALILAALHEAVMG